jgi:hypothetical protein
MFSGSSLTLSGKFTLLTFRARFIFLVWTRCRAELRKFMSLFWWCLEKSSFPALFLELGVMSCLNNRTLIGHVYWEPAAALGLQRQWGIQRTSCRWLSPHAVWEKAFLVSNSLYSCGLLCWSKQVNLWNNNNNKILRGKIRDNLDH